MAARPEPLRPPTDLLRAMLERDMVDWADDVSLRLVWADLLQIEGDPLGRLVVLDHFGATVRGEAGERARAEAELVREHLNARLWTRSWKLGEAIELRWMLGSVRELDVYLDRWPHGRSPDELLPSLLREPAMRFVEMIRVHAIDHRDIRRSSLSWLRKASHPVLREFHAGHVVEIRERPSGPWEPGRAVANSQIVEDVATRFPRLHHLGIDGELMRVPCRDGGTQARVHYVRGLAKRPLTGPNRAGLARALWDMSTNVQEAAFATITELGPRAVFVLDDLELLLRPPIGKRDPRPAQALLALAAIGPSGASLLPIVLRPERLAEILEIEARCLGLLAWLRALGSAGKAALPVVDRLLVGNPKLISSAVRSAARSARKALDEPTKSS